jgi:plastocyanin
VNILIATLIAALTLTGTLMAGDIVGTISAKGVRDARNVVIYVESIAEPGSPPVEHAVMDQKDLEFVPHVLPIIKGSTVDFVNSDDVLHNVFTPDKCADKMNLGSWPKGESRSYTYEEEGCVSVMLCNVHPEMEAWVVVLPNGFFAKTGKDGEYRIEGVPPGKHTITAWHEKLKSKTVEIEIPAEGDTSVDFTLTR